MNDKKEMVTVPYIAYEKEMSGKNTIIKFLIFTIIVFIIAFVIMIKTFMTFIDSHEFKSYNQDGNGVNNINTGMQGDITNESTPKDNN